MNLYTCPHENDACTTILVARPHYRSILIANEDLRENLYREKVKLDVLHEQHEHLINILAKEGNCVVHDIMSHIHADATNANDTGDHSSRNDLGNMIFTRDPILCTARGIVLGRFKEPVRRIETDLVKTALRHLNVPILGRVASPGFVEGGDFIPAGERSFIAIGNRTNMHGVQQMLDNDWFGSDYVAIVEYPKDGQMKAIHLDCYLGIVGKQHVVVWNHALKVATVTEMRRMNGVYQMNREKVPLAQYLTYDCGLEMIIVDDHSQEKYACNLLDIGNGCVLSQEEVVNRELLDRGYKTVFIPFHEVHKMYGGIRCATQAIQRIPTHTKNTQ